MQCHNFSPLQSRQCGGTVCTSEDCFVLGCVMIAAGAGQPRYCHWADSGDRHRFSARADSTYQYQYYLVVHLCTQAEETRKSLSKCQV